MLEKIIFDHIKLPNRAAILTFCSCFHLFIVATPIYAVNIRPTVYAALMQVPASQYYLAAYGSSIDTVLHKSATLRASYLERPKFSASGYEDQDLSASAQVGLNLYEKNKRRISAYYGVGRCWGYIKETESSTGDGSLKRSDYQINGALFTAEGSQIIGDFDLVVGHSLFVGVKNKSELSNQIAWPYAFFYGGIGYVFRVSR